MPTFTSASNRLQQFSEPLKKLIADKYLSEKVKGQMYTALLGLVHFALWPVGEVPSVGQ